MERYIDFKQISDGRLYTANDLVRADAGGCAGCSACCRGMGISIVLDPYDCMCLCRGLSCDFSALLAGPAELNVQEGLILPNLKMNPQTDSCSFLSEDGRCRIHAFRPGFCRLFPLGRYYDGSGFSYFLQTKECPYPSKTKVKIRPWLDIPDYPRYERFVTDWHYFLKRLSARISEKNDAAYQRQAALAVLQQFYLQPFDPDTDFYTQMQKRLQTFPV